MSLVAFAVDAGFAPPAVAPEHFTKTFRGYDKLSVDRFLDTLASDDAGVYGRPMACPWPFASEEPPFLDRPVVGKFRAPASVRRSRAEKMQYARDCDGGWMRFADLPGTRLRCTRTGLSNWAPTPISSGGHVLLTPRGETWTVAASGQMFLRNKQWWDGHPVRQVVDAATGRPILQMVGIHRCRQAKTVVLRTQQRWFRFPVQGSRLGNGVMTAVDQSYTEVLWFRKTVSGGTQVVVSPQCVLTPEILCVIAEARPWLDYYFAIQGGWSEASGPSADPPVRKRDASETAQTRMPVVCVECGAETTREAQLCVRCGAPVVDPRPVDDRSTGWRDGRFP